MGGKLSPNVEVDIDGGLDLDITLPTSYSFAITQLPQIDLNVQPVDITLQPVDLTVRPLDVSLRLKEIPSVRAHLPVNYKLGFALLGRELACVHLCGQGQAITEPYNPYPCEPRPAKFPDLQKVETRKPAARKASKKKKTANG